MTLSHSERKEQDKLYAREYYRKNKEKLGEQIKCSCGGVYKKYNKSHHCRTKKHLDWLQKEEDTKREQINIMDELDSLRQEIQRLKEKQTI